MQKIYSLNYEVKFQPKHCLIWMAPFLSLCLMFELLVGKIEPKNILSENRVLQTKMLLFVRLIDELCCKLYLNLAVKVQQKCPFSSFLS